MFLYIFWNRYHFICWKFVFLFFSFTSSSSVADFPRLFVAFVAFIEVVSLWLVLVILIGIPILIAAKHSFLLFKSELKIYDMSPHNIYHFSFPIYSQQTLDVAAVCGDAGQFIPIDIFTGIGQLHKFSNFSYEKILFVWQKILPPPCWCFLIVSHWLFFSQK